MSRSTPDANESARGDPFPAPPFINIPGQIDVILRASDGVDFYVHRAVLSLVSPVFQTMFTLPQAEQLSSSYPVIDVQEASPVLDRTLRFFYPGTELTVGSLDELQEIMEILISKYDMQCLARSVQRHLECYVASDPLAVYAFAGHYRWEELARAAAIETLKIPLRTSDDDTPAVLDLIPASTYHKLLRYHYRCGAAAQKTTRDLSWIPWPESPFEYRWFTCQSCAMHPVDNTQPLIIAGRGRNVRSWFMEYFLAIGNILSGTPSANVADPTHPLFIQAIKKANACGHCRDCVSTHLQHFAALWKSRIAMVTLEIEWKFKRSHPG
ncbi:hypothetical protein C8R45DRAFT_873978 [Mycena sanguinolenta]|nr:hypothetical protein C8R45DRAFT_873978 [Mycena sanguinolenta]